MGLIEILLVIVFIIWLGGFVFGVGGGLIHIFLIIIVIILLIKFIEGGI